jgi:hypothetical protein
MAVTRSKKDGVVQAHANQHETSKQMEEVNRSSTSAKTEKDDAHRQQWRKGNLPRPFLKDDD